LGQAGRGVAAATDFAGSLANMLSGRTALALIVASFGVTMSPNLSLTQSAYSVRWALTANRRIAESLGLTIPQTLLATATDVVE
jgi:hypothetical protein